MNIIQALNFDSKNPCQMHIVCAILEIENCRSAEVLNAKWKNFIPDKFLVLEGCKKSSNVIVRDREILKAISNLDRIDKTFIFPSVTYKKLYRFIQANFAHQFKQFKKRKNLKVTHGFRYANVSQFENDEIIRDILHHRSTKSGKYYKSKKGVN